METSKILGFSGFITAGLAMMKWILALPVVVAQRELKDARRAALRAHRYFPRDALRLRRADLRLRRARAELLRARAPKEKVPQ